MGWWMGGWWLWSMVCPISNYPNIYGRYGIMVLWIMICRRMGLGWLWWLWWYIPTSPTISHCCCFVKPRHQWYQCRHFGGSLRQGEWWGIGTSCQVGHPRQMHPWKSSETWFWYPKLSHPLMSMSPLIERKLGDIVVWSLIEPTSLAHVLKSSRFSSQGKGIPSCNTNIEDGWTYFDVPVWHDIPLYIQNIMHYDIS